MQINDTRMIAHPVPGPQATVAPRRVLLIDDFPGTTELLKHLVSVAMPEVTLSVYEMARGCPDA